MSYSVFGAMTYMPLLSRIIRREGVVKSYPIRLDNACLTSELASFPCPTTRTGSYVDGLLLSDLTAEEEKRLIFFSGVINAEPRAYQLPEGKDTTVFWSQNAAGSECAQFEPEKWIANWSAIALEATQEIMSYYKHKSMVEVRAGLPMILLRAHARVQATMGVPANIRSRIQYDQVEVVQQDSPHMGFFATRDFRLRHPTFSGGQSPIVRREVFVATDAAIVLPYDPVHDRVLLVEQFRMGPFGRGDIRPWMLEPVAGRVDPGETPEATARRECEEEAGLTLHRLEKISSHYCSPGCSTEYFHLFLGICDLPDITTGQGGLDSEDEDIRTHVLLYEDAMDLLTTGEADNGPLVLSLLWLARERERLRSVA